jgi:hypothetical protein
MTVLLRRLLFRGVLSLRSLTGGSEQGVRKPLQFQVLSLISAYANSTAHLQTL